MPDNPNKKGQDRKFISKQSHEQSYQKRKASKATSDTNGRKSQTMTIKGLLGRGHKAIVNIF